MNGGKYLAPVVLSLVCIFGLSACNHKQAPAEHVKRYHLTGRIVAVDKPNKSLTIDGDEIPGFMAAMQMPYDVKDASLLDSLAPGDKIATDVVVKDDESWLENIKVSEHAPAGKSTSKVNTTLRTVA